MNSQMENFLYHDKLKKKVFDILETAFRNMIMELEGTELSETELKQAYRELMSLGIQYNTGALMNPTEGEKLLTHLQADKRYIWRWGFITRTMQTLKFTLGDDDWKQVVRDVASASELMGYVGDSQGVKGSLLSNINQLTTKPNIDYLQANQWLVVWLLFGLWNRSYIVITTFLAERDMLQSRRAKNVRRPG